MREKIEKAVFLRASILLLLLTVCSILVPGEAKAAPKLNKSAVTLVKGESYTLKFKGTKKKATWKTSKKTVAKLTNVKKTSVKVTAVKAGKTTISAKIGKKTYKCKVNVVETKLNYSNLSLKVGEVKKLKVSGGTGETVWKSSNTSVAVVGADGKVVAIGSGTTKITAKRNGSTVNCKLKVRINITNKGKSKKVWVITRKAYSEKVPVLKTVEYYKCLTCGSEFEGDNATEEYVEHANTHMDKGQEARYTVLSKQVPTGEYKTVRHEEEGYYITIHY